MPANFMRRRDLFADAGFDPDETTEALVDDAEAMGLTGPAPLPLDTAIDCAERTAAALLPQEVRSLIETAPEWLFSRGGDLAAFLWLARRLATGGSLRVGAAIFGLAAQMWKGGRRAETAGLIRFLVDLDFDYGALYRQKGVAHEFFNARDPNPLVWKLLKHVGAASLDVLELGCGIGNDAVGLVDSSKVRSYEGVDVSDRALEHHRERVEAICQRRPELDHRLHRSDILDFLRARADAGDKKDVVYSYSSLHYFNSKELQEIFDLTKRVLRAEGGLFVFGIKGKASIWDGQGVPLYRPDVWINLDGQSRWFPSRSILAQAVARYGFRVVMHELHEHWGYSERGEPDVFHYVLCSPVTERSARPGSHR